MKKDTRILQELRGHLLSASTWADPLDYLENELGWSCIKSTLDAIDDGNVGLALTRWDDLCSPLKPVLSKEAQEWRANG